MGNDWRANHALLPPKAKTMAKCENKIHGTVLPIVCDVRRDHLTMDISDDEKGRIIPLWIVNYLIGYIYPDDIL